MAKRACQVCQKPDLHIIVDGATTHGPWAYMCVECHTEIGVGLGTGRGQKYEWNEIKQRYTKIEG